jgi:hypothetical protein
MLEPPTGRPLPAPRTPLLEAPPVILYVHMSVVMRMQVTANNHDAYEWMQMNEHG